MDWKVRRLPASRLSEALALCREVFLEFDAPEFQPEGIAAFLAALEERQVRRMVRSGLLTFWGAFCGRQLAGMGALRENRHISLLFVRGELHRRGVGSALVREMLRHCARAGTERVTVYASPQGVNFYRAMGFRPFAPEQLRDGIRYIPMERTEIYDF